MELFSDSTCCSHAWACYPTEMRYLVVTYMKSERTWTIPMPLTWMLYIFLMADDWRGSLIEIYIGLPRVFNAFVRFYFFIFLKFFLKQPFYRFIELQKVRRTCTGDVMSSYSREKNKQWCIWVLMGQNSQAFRAKMYAKAAISKAKSDPLPCN